MHLCWVDLYPDQTSVQESLDQPSEVSWGLFDYDTTDIVMHIHHGKTDKHGNFTPLDFVLPRGTLGMLLLAHITAGQHVIATDDDRYRITYLFLSGGGNHFSDATFCQWWASLLKRTAPDIEHFPPSLARTSFVEDYTSKWGVPPEMWDGAATIMGNSVSTWLKSYNPSHRRRKAAEAVGLHGRYVRARLAEQGEGEGSGTAHPTDAVV